MTFSTCSACLSRALRSIANDSPYPRLSSSASTLRATTPRIPRNYPLTNSTRTVTTLSSIKKSHHRQILLNYLQKGESVPRTNARSPAARAQREHKDVVARAHNNSLLSKESGNFKGGIDAPSRAAIREVQQYLRDPLELANAVLQRLRKDDLGAALDLVRASERVKDDDGNMKAVQNIVSWNHLCDWCMSKSETNMAVKIYNEMKKRGHKPDAHTYTIMLRGFGENVKKPNAVRDAVGIYNSIYAPNSAVKPNTIHTNAVINVCARGGDMDALWSVAGRLPEKGAGSPDRWTYTTILNAIHADAKKRAIQIMAAEGNNSDPSEIFREAVNDGQRLWWDIVGKWKSGSITIDEALVCAMGRLLVLAPEPRGMKEVFALVAQTMNFRLLGMGALKGPSGPDGADADSEESSRDTEVVHVEGKVNKAGPVTTSIYATPGNNTLSLLIEAAALVKQPQIGRGYWDVLTNKEGKYKVVPDAQNIIAYLRLLRLSRASKEALDILQQPWPDHVGNLLYSRGTFVIAMSTCARDKRNPNVFDTASRMLDLMQERVNLAMAKEVDNYEDRRHPGKYLIMDPKVLSMYLKLAIDSTKGLAPGTSLTESDNYFERDPQKNNTMRALKRLRPTVLDVKRLLKLKVSEAEYDDLPHKELRKIKQRRGFVDIDRVHEETDQLIELIRTMIGAYDRLMGVSSHLEDLDQKPLPPDLVDECLMQKRKLTAFLAKTEGALRSSKQEAWEQRKGRFASRTTEHEVGEAEQDESLTAKQDSAEDAQDDEDFDEIAVPGMTQTQSMRAQARDIKDQARSKFIRGNRISRRQKKEVEREQYLTMKRRQALPNVLKTIPEEKQWSMGRHRKNQYYQPGWGQDFDGAAASGEDVHSADGDISKL